MSRFLSSNAYISFLHRNASFRYIFLSGVISRIGDFMLFVSLSTILETESQNIAYNGIALAFFSAAWVIPQAAFAPYAGVTADLMDKKNVMLVADILRSLLVLLFFAFQKSTFACLLLVFAIESIAAFFNSSKESLIPQIVAEEDLEIANVLDSFVWIACTFLGCVIGGVSMILWGIEVCFVFDSITYLLSSACVVMLIRSEKEKESGNRLRASLAVADGQTTSRSVDTDLHFHNRPSHFTPQRRYTDTFATRISRRTKSPFSRRLCQYASQIPSKLTTHCTAFVMGLAFLLTNPFLLSLTIAKATHTVIYGANDVLIIIYSHGRFRLLDNPATFISIVRATSGISAGVSPLLVERWMPVKSSCDMLKIVCFSWIGVCFSMGTLCAASFVSSSVGALLFTAGIASMSFFGGLIWTYSTILLQKHTPENYCGRVLSFDICCFTSLGTAYGALSSGVLLDLGGFTSDGISLLIAAGSLFVGSCWIFHYFIYARQIDMIQPYWLFSEMRFSGMTSEQISRLRKRQKIMSTLKERGFSDSFFKRGFFPSKIQMSQPLLKDELLHKNR